MVQHLQVVQVEEEDLLVVVDYQVVQETHLPLVHLKEILVVLVEVRMILYLELDMVVVAVEQEEQEDLLLLINKEVEVLEYHLVFQEVQHLMRVVLVQESTEVLNVQHLFQMEVLVAQEPVEVILLVLVDVELLTEEVEVEVDLQLRLVLGMVVQELL